LFTVFGILTLSNKGNNVSFPMSSSYPHPKNPTSVSLTIATRSGQEMISLFPTTSSSHPFPIMDDDGDDDVDDDDIDSLTT